MRGYMNIPAKEAETAAFVEQAVCDLVRGGRRVEDAGDHYMTVEPDGTVIHVLKE